MNEKVDRRIRKTKSQLRAGLTKLMREKSIKEITVKELVDTVDINRSTFYLHYADINQLLESLEEELLSEIVGVIQSHSIASFDETSFLFIQNIFTILSKNVDLCCALLGPNGDISFVHQIENLISEQYHQVFQSIFTDEIIDIKYFHAFCLTGCVGLIKAWLTDGAKESPEHMAKLAFTLIANATKDFRTNKTV